MICSNCKKIIPDGRNFCRFCGARININDSSNIGNSEEILDDAHVKPNKAERGESAIEELNNQILNPNSIKEDIDNEIADSETSTESDIVNGDNDIDSNNQNAPHNRSEGQKTRYTNHRQYRILITVMVVLLCCAIAYILFTDSKMKNSKESASNTNQDDEHEYSENVSGENEADEIEETEDDHDLAQKDDEEDNQYDAFGYVMGKVTDAKSGTPIDEANIILTSTQGEQYPDETATKTDENGSFMVKVPVGRYSLLIAKEGYTDYLYEEYFDVNHSETTQFDNIEMISDNRVESDVEVETAYYILPDSNSRYLTEDDLNELSEWELKLARNEIYARHGRRFNDPDLQHYFDQQSWYIGSIAPDDFDKNYSSEISALEKKNAEFILQYELQHGYYT